MTRHNFHLAYIFVIILSSSPLSIFAHYGSRFRYTISFYKNKEPWGSATPLRKFRKNKRPNDNGCALQAFEQSLVDTLCLRGGSDYSNGNGRGYYGDYRGDKDDPDDYYGSSSRDNSYYSERREYEEDPHYPDDRYERNDRYDDRGANYQDDSYDSSRKSSRSRSPSSTTSFLPSSFTGIIKTNRKLGFTFLASGSGITLLGITLFFNKTLLRLGNILFLLGIPLTIGPGRTMGYFLQPKKARATSCLAAGAFLVLIGYPVFGIALEVFGLLNLFGNMFPVLLMFLRSLPFVGDLIPDGKNKKKKNSSRDRKNYDDDYDDRYYDQGNSNAEQYY